MNRRRTIWSSLLGALLVASLPGTASAHGGISFDINVGPPIYYTPPPAYYAAPPSYYYRPPPVQYGYPVYPQARVYNRGYYAPPGYGYGRDDDAYSRHEWREHQGWHHHHDDDDD